MSEQSEREMQRREIEWENAQFVALRFTREELDCLASAAEMVAAVMRVDNDAPVIQVAGKIRAALRDVQS